jgi:CHAT domain-containing protein/tetratricopeptide (TPR) repeat protein
MRGPRKDRVLGWLAAGGLAILLGVPWAGAGDKPAQTQGAQRKAQLEDLERQMTKALGEGAFERAAEVAGRIASLREDWRGKQHGRSVAARAAVKRYEALACLPAEDRRDVARSFRAEAEGEDLAGRNQFPAAEELHRKALAIRTRVLGEDHPFTALSCTDIADTLFAQGKYRDAQPWYDKALAIRRKSLGEEHPQTADSYANVAITLDMQGRPREAQPLYEEALRICRKVLGEEDVDTASCYSNVAYNLYLQGKYAEGEPLLKKTLAVSLKVLGDGTEDAAAGYNNLAYNLKAQGKFAEAQPLYEKALANFRKAIGEEKADTAIAYNNLADNLTEQGRYADAKELYEKALAIRIKVVGAEHHATAISYNSLASNLHAQARYAEAQPLFEKALAIRRKALGEEHPETASSFNEVAFNLNAQGKYAQAQTFMEKALAAERKGQGEHLLETAFSCVNLATSLEGQRKYAEAQPLYEKALAIRREVLGEEHPRTALACTCAAANLLRQGKTDQCVRLLQASLPSLEAARFHRGASGFDRAVATPGLETSPHVLLAVGLARLGRPAAAFRHAEAGLARGLLDDLAGPGKDEAAELDALHARLDRLDEQFLPLFGRTNLSADEKALREELGRQRRETLARVARLSAAVSLRQVLPLADIQKQLPDEAALVYWLDLDRLGEHDACVLRARGEPAWVRLPGRGEGGAWTAWDIDLQDRFYRCLQRPGSRPDEWQPLSAELTRQRLEPLRPHLGAGGGLPAVRHLLVVPTGWAGRVPLEVLAGDYRISYVPSGSVFARLRQQHRPVKGSSLLALGDPAFTSRPPGDDEVVRRGPDPVPLPGTRWEVQALARLVPGTATLLGSDASEQRLDELARDGRLKAFRLIHLATHGVVDEQTPDRSRLLLARDRLPDARDTLPGSKRISGDLTVAAIRGGWKLDADLVALSACKTALGREGRGEGLLGFAQAFLQGGARSVVLSRWEADDTATALLMLRFYENLLGARKDLKAALPRAEALAEAKAWLRGLPRADAEGLASALRGGKLSDTRTRGRVVELNVKEGPGRLPEGDRPYSHPFFWAPFVLVGDPE